MTNWLIALDETGRFSQNTKFSYAGGYVAKADHGEIHKDLRELCAHWNTCHDVECAPKTEQI